MTQHETSHDAQQQPSASLNETGADRSERSNLFPDAEATVAEVKRFRRTGRLPRRLRPVHRLVTLKHPAWQYSRLATQIMEALCK